jgi:hypothetical protein
MNLQPSICNKTAPARTGLLSLVAMALIAAPTTAFTAEQAVFDGTWSVSVETKKGLCSTGYTYSVRIVDGVLSGSGDTVISGRVTENGSITVMVVQGYKKAAGSGRLIENAGSGRWSGHACSGSWHAARG